MMTHVVSEREGQKFLWRRGFIYTIPFQPWLRAVGVVSDAGLQIRSLLKRLGVRFSLRAATNVYTIVYTNVYTNDFDRIK